MRCKITQSIKGLHFKLTTFFLNLMTLRDGLLQHLLKNVIARRMQ
jgi:hypothetical protein